jgi:hypothetical protein
LFECCISVWINGNGDALGSKKIAFVVLEKENPMHLVKWLASGERFLFKNYYAIRKTSVG